MRHMAEHLDYQATLNPDMQTIRLTGDQVLLVTPPVMHGDPGDEPIAEPIEPNANGLYAIPDHDWSWQEITARKVVTGQLRALLHPRTRHRRFRLAVMAHAAATMLQQRITRTQN